LRKEKNYENFMLFFSLKRKSNENSISAEKENNFGYFCLLFFFSLSLECGKKMGEQGRRRRRRRNNIYI